MIEHLSTCHTAQTALWSPVPRRSQRKLSTASETPPGQNCAARGGTCSPEEEPILAALRGCRKEVEPSTYPPVFFLFFICWCLFTGQKTASTTLFMLPELTLTFTGTQHRPYQHTGPDLAWHPDHEAHTPPEQWEEC